MSYSFDGKIVNQSPRFRFNSGTPQPTCENCCTIVNTPENAYLNNPKSQAGDPAYFAFHYIGKKEFIYETKSGFAVVYCSAYCRRKHNHRFK